jgi:hypothetical protein
MKIAFIETIYHQKTQSSYFFKELLSKKYQMKVMLDDPFIKGDHLDIETINNQNFDVIIFWQFIKDPTQIEKIKCNDIIWIPMYDGEIVKKLKYLRNFGYAQLNLKIISFSKSLTKIFQKSGFKHILEIQYFPKPNIKIQEKNEGLNIFFWQRTETINWNIVKNLISKNKINKITIKNNPDVGHVFNIYPTNEEINKYNIEILEKWFTYEKYIDFLKKQDVFIEPRLYEGIGMGFLDAMSYGVPVISPNEPTMNEYITDKKNGYLYDYNNPKNIDLKNIEIVKANLKKYIENNYSKWTNSKEEIYNFIENKKVKKNNLNWLYKIYGIPLEKIIIIKRKIINITKNLF